MICAFNIIIRSNLQTLYGQSCETTTKHEFFVESS